MINNSPLDEHIRDKFADYSPDVPAHIWENIVAGKEKKRPAAFWLYNKTMVLLLCGILIAGAGIIIYKNVSSSKNDHTTATAEPVNKDGQATINGSNKNTTATTATKNSETTISSENKITEPGTNNSSLGNTSSAEVAPIASEKIKAAGNIPGTNNNKSKPAYNSDRTIKTNSVALADDKSMIKGAGNKKLKRSKGSAVVTYTNADIASDDKAAENPVENNSQALFMNRQLLNLDMIRAEKTLSASVKRSNNPHLDIPCPDAEKDAAGNKRYFEIYGGPDYAFRSITDTGNSAYLQKRKESSTFSSAFSAGLRYTRVFGNGMSFRTGINYSQINEKFQFAQGNIIQVVYVVDNNGDTTGSYTTTGTRYKTTHNKFRTLDIPILIGYEMGNGRIHANFNAGAVVNIYSWQKGDVLDMSYQPVSITTGKETSPYQFKTNVGIGFMGAVSVYYKIAESWHIFAEPYFRYNFSAASKSELTLKQKYNTAGLRLGIRMDF